jgi:TonB family protein
MAGWHELDEQIREAQSRFEEPGEWRRTEIEVLVDADGTLLDIRAVSPSGRAQLDTLALEAVRQAVSTRPPRAGARRTRARFLVEAGVSITLPQTMSMVDPGGGQQTGAVLKLFSLSFDESTGKVSSFDHPFKKHVRTRVSLSYVAPEE